MNRSICLLGLAAVLTMGCGGGARSPEAMSAKKADPSESNAPAVLHDDSSSFVEKHYKNNADLEVQQPNVKPAAEPKPRLVMYNGDMRLVVKEFAGASEDLVRLVTENGGYVASTKSNTASGQKRLGTWRVKIPVAKFDGFRKAVDKLGEVVEFKLDSEDVSDRYYDMEARVINMKKEEDKLRALFDKTAGTVNDVKEFSRMLMTIRGEIEVMEGQLKRWAVQSAEATLTIHVEEKHNYVPLVKVEEKKPVFGDTVANTWDNSIEGLTTVGQFLALTAVAVAPWLPPLLVVVGLVWFVMRRSKKARKALPVVVQSAAPAAQ